MIGTFVFYLAFTFKNHIVALSKRLRQPKYLISALVGLGYVYLFFFRQLFSRPRPRAAMPGIFGTNLSPIVETGCAFLLLGFVLLPWVWPGRGREGLRFTEAEIQFLFPAPVSRQALIRFRLVKMQLGILFGVIISFLFGRGSYFAHPVYFLLTLWVVYSFLGLYYTGTTLTQTSLGEHGISGLRRQIWALAVLAVLVGAIVVWVEWFIPPLPKPGAIQLDEVATWLTKLTESGPAYYFIYPFKILVRPAFASGPIAFLVRLTQALLILWLAYLWVMRSDASFEEASVERARRFASRVEAARSGMVRRSDRTAPRVRRPPFQLAPAGMAHTPIFWKNLISVGRLDLLRVLPAIVSIGIAMAVMFSTRGGRQDVLPTIIGSLAGAMAGFLTMVGPMLVRDDLRSDLLQADLLKTYPLPGWTVVLGEVLAPATILALAEWALLLIAALVLPSVGKVHLSATLRVLVGLSAAFVLPCLSLIGVLIQNAAALMWPGWVELGKARRQGIEAMGQRLITMLATVIALVFAVIPAGLLFGVVYFAGSWLVGLAILPFAALLAALALLAEAGVAILFLGRLYDRFDVSVEGAGH